MATANVTVEGFRTDLFSAFYPLTAASPVIRSLDLGSHGVRWSRAPAVLTHVLPDGSAATLWQDADRTAASLESFGAGDGEAWVRLTRQWDRIGDRVVDALLEPFPPVRPAIGLLRRLGLADTLRLARMAIQPVRRFGEENFTGPGGPMLFAGNALHADLPPDGAGSAVYGWLLTMLGHSVGFPVPVGGAGALIDGAGAPARSRSVRSCGPRRRSRRWWCATGGRVAVVLASGERIEARRAVLADVAAPALFGRARRARPPAAAVPARPGELPVGRADLESGLGTRASGAVDGSRRRRLRHRAPGRGHGRAHRLRRRSADPPRPEASVHPVRTDDHRRPDPFPGRHRIGLGLHAPAAAHRSSPPTTSNARSSGSKKRSRSMRRAFARASWPGTCRLRTTWSEHDCNLVTGAINGGTAQLHQQLVFRPVPGLAGAATPVDRLFLAGSSAHPGGGVHGACGSNAAHAALSRDAFAGPARRAAQSRLMRRIYREPRS